MVALYAPLSLALTAIAHMAPSAEAVIHEPPEGARLDYAAPPPPKASDETIEPDTPSSDAEADDEAEAPGDGEAREAFELQPPSPEGRRGPSPGIPGRKRRTPQWGTRWFNVAVHASSNSVGVGLGALLFPTPYLGLGLDVDEIVIFDVATVNLFQITPKAVVLVLPYRRVTPILSGGFGGAFFSRRLGAYGRWTAGGGLMFAIGERLTAGFGMDVEGLLPRDRYARNFECRLSQQQCAMGLAPWVSFGFRL